MESTIHQRLDILKQGNQITEKMEMAITTLLEKLEDIYQLEVTEENGAMLVMHLAIALARIEQGETVARMDDVVIDQIRGAKGFDELPEFLGDLESEMGWKIQAEEFEYMSLHFCTVIEKGGRA